MTFRYAHRSPRHLHHAVKELDDGGSFGGSMSGHARAPRGTHTASRPRNPSNRPTSWAAVGACEEDVGPLLGFRGRLALGVTRCAVASTVVPPRTPHASSSSVPA